MTDRSVFDHNSSDFDWKDRGAAEGLGKQYSRHITNLYNASALPITSMAGTNNYTGTVDPTFTSGWSDGMKVTGSWPNTNTSATVNLNINSEGNVQVLLADGSAPAIGDLVQDSRFELEYFSGDLYLLSPTGVSAVPNPDYQDFTATGTWTKPTGFDADALVIVELWGGGGGGGTATNGGGGGGGGYATKRFRYGDLASTVSITIGSGGAAATAGGNTTFGTLLTAFGGGRAGGTTGSTGGGGGGGENAVGANGTGFGGGTGGSIGGGDGGNEGLAGENAKSTHGGGGGAAGAGGGQDGGDGAYGGAGGGGMPGGNGGVSAYAGDGGDDGVAASAPGGGGGRNASGARGEARIWVVS